MDRQTSPSVIFSVCRNGYADSELHKAACRKLYNMGIPYRVLRGCYMGVEEPSILVNAKYIEIAELLAEQHSQESILTFDQFYNVTVKALSGLEYKTGRLQPVASLPANCQNWTLDEEVNQYWIVR